MTTYKPLSDAELPRPEWPPLPWYVVRLEEQARRANKLAEAYAAFRKAPSGKDCSWSMEEREALRNADAALRSYLGELGPAEGGG